MKHENKDEQFRQIYDLASKMVAGADADALLVLLNGHADWERLEKGAKKIKTLVASADEDQLARAPELGLEPLLLEMHEAPVTEMLAQALVESVASEILTSGSEVIALYSCFDAGHIDSISYIRLDERLQRLTARDLRKLETRVPLDTLRTVVDLAVEIGREGREGKRVGTMFVVGDTRRVLAKSRPACYDPVKGYSRDERNLHDARTREAIKEIAQLDGAMVVSPDGTVEKSCQIIDFPSSEVTTLSKGLGSRHWAGASVSKHTNAIAVVVSESNGTVRLFQNGEVILRIEPFRRAMKWKNFSTRPQPPEKE